MARVDQTDAPADAVTTDDCVSLSDDELDRATGGTTNTTTASTTSNIEKKTNDTDNAIIQNFH